MMSERLFRKILHNALVSKQDHNSYAKYNKNTHLRRHWPCCCPVVVSFVFSFVVALNRVHAVSINKICVFRVSAAGLTASRTDSGLDGRSAMSPTILACHLMWPFFVIIFKQYPVEFFLILMCWDNSDGSGDLGTVFKLGMAYKSSTHIVCKMFFEHLGI